MVSDNRLPPCAAILPLYSIVMDVSKPWPRDNIVTVTQKKRKR